MRSTFTATGYPHYLQNFLTQIEEWIFVNFIVSFMIMIHRKTKLQAIIFYIENLWWPLS